MESFFAVHSGSVGTGFWMRNQSLPGVECRVQYSRGWSERIWIPERMMKIIRNRLKKCAHPTHAGKPALATAAAEKMVPRMRGDELLHRRGVAQALRHRHCDRQDEQPDRQQPQQVEPLAPTDPHPRGDPRHLRHRPRPGGGVNHLLTHRQLGPEAAHRLRATRSTVPERAGRPGWACCYPGSRSPGWGGSFRVFLSLHGRSPAECWVDAIGAASFRFTVSRIDVPAVPIAADAVGADPGGGDRGCGEDAVRVSFRKFSGDPQYANEVRCSRSAGAQLSGQS